MAQNEVKIKVRPQKVGEQPEALEKQLARLKATKLQFKIDAKTEQLNEVNSKIDQIQSNIQKKTALGIDDTELEEAKAELEALKEQKVSLEIDVNDAELKQAKEMEKSLNTTAEVQIKTLGEIADSSDFMNMGQGFTQTKQGLSDIKNGIEEVQQAGMQTQQNIEFLRLNEDKLGGKSAVDTYREISDIVKKMPGDDNTMRSVLSTAQALGNNLDPTEMENAATTMSDYMAGSATMGKQALESQQDIMKYLLDGNTAELEKGSIVSSQVDKLKEATTFQERQVAMQEVLNDLGYGGIGNAETLINKQAEWEGMMYNAKSNLSTMWIPFEQGMIDAFVSFDEKQGGIASMAIALADMAGGPLIDIGLGLGQIGTGLDGMIRGFDILKKSKVGQFFGNLKTKIVDAGGSIKNGFKNALSSASTYIKTSFIPSVKSAALTIKTTFVEAFSKLTTYLKTSVIPALKNAGIWLLETGKRALIGGYNALKSAGMWLIEKASLIASTIATKAMAVAQGLLNIVMSMNPIFLVVIALMALIAALTWAYYNVDWFREMVDNAFATLVNLATTLWNFVKPIIDMIAGAFNSFTESLGLNKEDWVQTILAFILFLPTLPMQLGIILLNAIANLLGFKGNFVQHMMDSAKQAVDGFLKNFTLENVLKTCLDSAVNMIMSHPLVQTFVWLGEQASNAFSRIGLNQGSPGNIYHAMKDELDWTREMVNKDKLPEDTGKLGSNLSSSFNPSLDTSNLSINQSGSKGFNLTINIESVDSKDRINQIVKAVEEAMNFDNETAGRGV